MDALDDLRALDDLFGILAGSYVEIKTVWLEVMLPDRHESVSDEFQLIGYGSEYNAEKFVDWRDILGTHGPESDWYQLVRNFMKLRDKNKIAFKWFRASETNELYLEERFSYAVRLVEVFFRSSSEIDVDMESALAICTQRANDDQPLMRLVESRLRPIARRPASLAATLRALFRRYPEIAAFSEISPQLVARLRGKEMHG